MLRYFLSPLFWAATILFLSSVPSKDLPNYTLWEFFTFDKFVHVGMYAVLAFQVMKACVRQYANWTIRYNAAKIAAVSGIIYGGLIELFQEYMLVDRHGDWMDLTANIIGCFLGIWIFRKLFVEYIR